MSSPALELDSVTGGYDGTVVLRDVTIRVDAGAVTALIGSNGVGKTTLLKIASGVLRPDAGQVRMNGDDVTRLPPAGRARAGLCHIREGRSVFRSMTVAENLRLFTPPWLQADPELAFEVFPVLRRHMGRVAGTLSGGEQQMLALSRAVLARPAVVLLDEVSMGLAPIIVDTLFESLGVLRERGAALLVVEQYIQRVLAIADDACILAHGEVRYAGPANQIDEEQVMQEYLGVQHGAATGSS